MRVALAAATGNSDRSAGPAERSYQSAGPAERSYQPAQSLREPRFVPLASVPRVTGGPDLRLVRLS